VRRKNPVVLKLGLNPLKGDNELHAIRIAAAMEVKELIPVFYRRTDVPFDEKQLEKRLYRWLRACVSEAEQSGGAFLPEISQPIALEDLIASERPRTLFFYENADPFQDDPKFTKDEEILALIGPEGGIDDGEAEFARENGCEIVSLGDWTLRAQYAASQVPLWVYSRVN
jgi:16S rRNA (uracil1498-N3)-methyltransferase